MCLAWHVLAKLLRYTKCNTMQYTICCVQAGGVVALPNWWLNPHCWLQVANDTIIMLIGLVYCVIQPIIAPLAMIYFAIGVLIWKYQVVYVYVPLVESGGKVQHFHPTWLRGVLLNASSTMLQCIRLPNPCSTKSQRLCSSSCHHMRQRSKGS